MARLAIGAVGIVVVLGASPAWAENEGAEPDVEAKTTEKSDERPVVDPDSGLPLPGEATAPDDEAKPEVPPDLVRLSDGGILRGVITEYQPQQKVTILLASGKSRTVSASLVDYAGPQEDDPGPTAAKPEAKVAPGSPRVQFVSEAPDLKLYLPLGERPTGERWHAVRMGDKYYDEICAPPCSAELEPGRYWLAAGVSGEEPVPFKKQVSVRPGDTVEVDYADGSSRRTLGWVLFGGALLAGGTLTTVAAATGGVGGTSALATGFGVAFAAPIGLVVALESDSASFEVRPAQPVQAEARSRPARLTF